MSTPALRYFVVDAFTDRPFSGNPAAVVPIPARRDDAWLQNVAMEMNLSETAFLLKEADGYRLRWFTPKVEVDLCGHATLASAHVLWTCGGVDPAATINFHTRSGRLRADYKDGMIELDFPTTPPVEASPPDGLLDALGADAKYVGKSQFDWLIEIDTEEAVRQLAPDFARLARIDGRGAIVTARSTEPSHDFASRFFAPRAGIDEDPVTGSAHCCLGPYWQARQGKSQFVAHQVSARGGVLCVRVAGDRTFLGGKAVTVLRGELDATAVS